ncbi:uncharacterized protein PV09_05215 [Verruconis gallopava]|uniref:Uncharacterized protein n=1 Tax=Verruconis gallopava TaxID=253628 RepID=A0A0D2AA45_9PEZI|nr:uncharacterized protein PV09_05215 [Verruconis gallopava]KIW03445.1 hypothetical protein PV09_05215 [Verruconis gallopava]
MEAWTSSTHQAVIRHGHELVPRRQGDVPKLVNDVSRSAAWIYIKRKKKCAGTRFDVLPRIAALYRPTREWLDYSEPAPIPQLVCLRKGSTWSLWADPEWMCFPKTVPSLRISHAISKSPRRSLGLTHGSLAYSRTSMFFFHPLTGWIPKLAL